MHDRWAKKVESDRRERDEPIVAGSGGGPCNVLARLAKKLDSDRLGALTTLLAVERSLAVEWLDLRVLLRAARRRMNATRVPERARHSLACASFVSSEQIAIIGSVKDAAIGARLQPPGGWRGVVLPQHLGETRKVG